MMATATASEIAAYMGGGVLLCIMCEFAFIIGVEWWCEMFARRNERREPQKRGGLTMASTGGNVQASKSPLAVRNAAGGVRREGFACPSLIAPHRSGICANRRATRRLFDLSPASVAPHNPQCSVSLAAGAGFSISTLAAEVLPKRERTIGARAQNPRIVPAHGAGGVLPDHANPPRAQEADAPLACLAQRADRWGGSRQTLQGGAK